MNNKYSKKKVYFSPDIDGKPSYLSGGRGYIDVASWQDKLEARVEKIFREVNFSDSRLTFENCVYPTFASLMRHAV